MDLCAQRLFEAAAGATVSHPEKEIDQKIKQSAALWRERDA
jgi:hypothetical protein